MAAAEKAEKKEAPPADTSGSGGAAPSSKLPLILQGVQLVVTLGLAAIVFMQFSKESKKASVEDIAAGEEHAAGDDKKAEGGGEHGAPAAGAHGAAGDSKGEADKMLTIEEFTINLNSAGSVNPKFARVNIALEVFSKDTREELTNKMPQVRNTIIDLFNSKKPSDLATVEGRNYLKEELRNALNSFLATGKVKSVFFTNFALSS